ncbi:MAG: aminopeptidase P family protein, partial [Pseudomonadota bacterium]
MTENHYCVSRKIDPTKGARLDDGTPNDDDRIEIGPTRLAYQEWQAQGLKLPDLPKMREYRWQRLVSHINARQLDGLLVLDPLNIRYATDSTNMQLWNTHN